ncbi:hypothetical protein [Rhizobium oryzicola]|uniref:Antitoxin n=1 Tax=Rhizobium oryzicola TaxID=1232668 RepID=A0ABT8SVP4_9HYPH|nr:hypothetical protein [Rhizobium oryzicola]MDO1582391.1 hypothetical protein [Rhizobium oryzicola]
MSTPAIVKASDLKRMGEFVLKNPGLRVEIERNGVLIRVAPDIPVINSRRAVAEQEEIRL